MACAGTERQFWRIEGHVQVELVNETVLRGSAGRFDTNILG